MTVKRTFSLPDNLAAQLEHRGEGNRSAFVAAAISEKITRDDDWQRFVSRWGEPDDAVRAAMGVWKERVLGADAGPGGPAS